MSLLGAEGTRPIAVGALDAEAIFRLLRHKKGQPKISGKVFPKKGQPKFSLKVFPKKVNQNRPRRRLRPFRLGAHQHGGPTLKVVPPPH